MPCARSPAASEIRFAASSAAAADVLCGSDSNQEPGCKPLQSGQCFHKP